MKRILDFFFSVILIILLSPVIFSIGMMVFATMGRPVLFAQVRPGLKGKPFRIYKFRTMNNLINQSGDMLPDEMRLTKVGRFLRRLSLDELPQLFNVTKGDLSFVGPRPLLMEYLPLYTPDQARRHDVRPGITGWAQINGRNVITWEERFKLDIWYLDHKSLWLDMEILLRTVLKVAKGEGISAEGCVTMPKFTGSRTEG